MKRLIEIIAYGATALSIFGASLPVFGLSTTESMGNTYQKIEREFVVSAAHKVESICDSGDTLVTGSCTGQNRFDQPNKFDLAVSQPRTAQAVVIDAGTLKSAGDSAGMSCNARLVSPGQVILVETIVVCQKTVQ